MTGETARWFPRWRRHGVWYPRRVTARRAPQDRFVCDLDVELDSGRLHVTGRARDLSESAVCLIARDPIEPGTAVNVQLRLVLEWGASEALSLPGQVAWLTASEGAQQIGVVFTAMGPEVRQRLQVLLKVLLGQISLSTPTA